MIKVVCLKWQKAGGRKYFGAAHVNALYEMLQNKTSRDVKLYCITDDGSDINSEIVIINMPSEVSELTHDRQWAKLYLFSQDLAEKIGGRFVYMDLDVVVTGDISPLFSLEGEIVIAAGHRPGTGSQRIRSALRSLFFASNSRKSPVNSSFMIITSGRNTHLWEQFDVEQASAAVKENKLVGSDQAWIALKATELTITGREHGVLRYSSLPEGLHSLPPDVRLVFFPGSQEKKPWSSSMQRLHPWIKAFYPIGVRQHSR